jgi:hypothetical protein
MGYMVTLATVSGGNGQAETHVVETLGDARALAEQANDWALRQVMAGLDGSQMTVTVSVRKVPTCIACVSVMVGDECPNADCALKPRAVEGCTDVECEACQMYPYPNVGSR